MTGARHRVCVVTGSRAEYGLLAPVLDEAARRAALDVRLLVTGTHLSRRHGLTEREILADGRRIDARVDLDLTDDSRAGVARALGRAVTGLADALARIEPEVVVLLGDRWEILAAAQAALVLRIPVAHVHGGEVTTGAFDDAIRHAVTKMSHLHFVAAPEYGHRVVQMGEDPARVVVTGALGVDLARATPEVPRDRLAAELGVALGTPLLCLTHHPTTLGDGAPAREIAEVLAAVEAVEAAHPGTTTVCTGSNADPSGREVEDAVRAWVAAAPARRAFRASLGRARYAALVRHADAVVGNSSSGIIEAPSLGTPTVNVGPRQDGRLRAASVRDAACERASVAAAIEAAIAGGRRAEWPSPYDCGGGAAARIVDVLERWLRDGALRGARKEFRDATAATTGPAAGAPR
ncbi:MAG: UDP-N-acetylglucosamine 2-epimerase [Ilumatobacteraceae bacterium]